MNKDTPIYQTGMHPDASDALAYVFMDDDGATFLEARARTYGEACAISDERFLQTVGVGKRSLAKWNAFKAANPPSDPPPPSYAEINAEVDDLRAQLQSCEERVSELNGRLAARDKEVQDLTWKNQALTYRINQSHKMLDLVRNGLTVPELRRIGFTVDITITKEAVELSA